MSQFHIYQLDDFNEVGNESMGSKARDWYETTDDVPRLEPGKRWLFKVPDHFQGEIWSEKLAAEIGELMGLPTARVELAQLGEGDKAQLGTISLNFADPREGKRLEHGNELMEAQADRGQYVLDEEEQVGIDAVFDYLRHDAVEAPLDAEDQSKAADFYFTGYLILDGLIGNIDRHHQNWGVVRTSKEHLHLAPTFDHGACLGRELQDKTRKKYIEYKQIEQYATNKNAAAKIAPPGDNDRTAPFRLLDFLPHLGQDQALCFWLERTLSIGEAELNRLFDRLPPGLASAEAQLFAQAFTRFTRSKLTELHEEIC